jgi:predicted ABC-type transport system involved in lysophospholipase L1 biosynthesis ATPase subunit
MPHEGTGAVLELVGLTHIADRRVGGYSLGMRQHPGPAAALVGDPDVLVLDEPFERTRSQSPGSASGLRLGSRASPHGDTDADDEDGEQ